MFFKTGVIGDFAIFTGKHVLESLFNKVAGVRPATLFQPRTKRLQHRCFPVKIANTFFYRAPAVAAFVSLKK